MSRLEWNYEWRSTLAQQYAAGAAPRELAKNLGISRTAVLTQLKLANVTLRNSHQARGTRMANLTSEERQDAMKPVTAARLRKYPPQPGKARLPSRPALLARVRALEAGLDLAKAGLRTVAENERSQGSYGDHCRAVLAALAGQG